LCKTAATLTISTEYFNGGGDTAFKAHQPAKIRKFGIPANAKVTTLPAIGRAILSSLVSGIHFFSRFLRW
jgi:hypothetical protein